MNKLKMAVVGVVDLGAEYAKLMDQAYNIELTAICTIDEDLGKKIANLYGCKYYKKIEELAADEEVEAVSLNISDKYCNNPSKILAETGKHIFMEAPFAKTAIECEKIKNICIKNNIRLMVGHFAAFLPTVSMTKERYKRGEIGEVIQFDIKHQTHIGVAELLKGSRPLMFFLGVHDTYLIPYITGQRIIKVYAQTVQKVSKYSEDCIIVTITLENGAIGVIECGWQLPRNFPAFILNFTINGTKQTITSDTNFSGFEAFGEKYENITLDGYELNGISIQPHTFELQHFADCILNNKEFIVETDEAINSVKVVEAVFESLEKGIPVKIAY